MFEKEPTTEIKNAGAPSKRQAPEWDALYARIRELAMDRSDALLNGGAESDDEFDRGARALRTLMGAAEIARRIKTAEEKETAAHEEDRKEPAFTDEEIRNAYKTVTAQLDRIEGEARVDGAGPDAASADAALVRNGGGQDLGGARP